MKMIEANHIIENYKLHRGFYDLSKKPETLTKIQYAKALSIQEFLAEQGKHKKYLQKFEPIQYIKDKEIAANYQMVIREHWKF